MTPRTPPRSHLRLADLKQRRPTASKLLNVKIPASIAVAIADLAEQLGASKTEVVVALLSAGLDVAPKRRG